MSDVSGPIALTIARPLRQALLARPFSGYIASRFSHACNVIDDERRVIALTLPAIGNGPFSIVLDAAPDLFAELELHQPARIDAERIVLGSWHIPLSTARTWDAMLPECARPLRLAPAIAAILRPYASWPPCTVDKPVSVYTARLLAQGACALQEALQRRTGVPQAARQLAGLGHGLTPAGDDYAVGVMAALWLLGERTMLPDIAHIAAPCTTALSGAFLMAAAEGLFLEAWHDLVQALEQQHELSIRKAVRRIAAFGASSGCDALAGFATTILNRQRDTSVR